MSLDFKKKQKNTREKQQQNKSRIRHYKIAIKLHENIGVLVAQIYSTKFAKHLANKQNTDKHMH